MKKPFAVASLLLAWLCANGALLDAVQVLAWGKMFAGYVKFMPVAAALHETFDPAKPCDMCISVAAVRADLEQKSAPVATERSSERLVLALEPEVPFVVIHVAQDWPEATPRRALLRQEDVPVPPPRV